MSTEYILLAGGGILVLNIAVNVITEIVKNALVKKDGKQNEISFEILYDELKKKNGGTCSKHADLESAVKNLIESQKVESLREIVNDAVKNALNS